MPHAKLTDAMIRALKPPRAGQADYWDQTPGFKGFGVRISQGGSRTFILMHGPKRTRTALGRFPLLTLAKAREKNRSATRIEPAGRGSFQAPLQQKDPEAETQNEQRHGYSYPRFSSSFRTSRAISFRPCEPMAAAITFKPRIEDWSLEGKPLRMAGRIWRYAISEGVPRRSFIVALIVGTILNLINQGDVMLAGMPLDLAKLLLTYLVPYCVSTYGAVSFRLHAARAAPSEPKAILAR